MSLLNSLLNADVPTSAAKRLSDEYGALNENDFLAGMEQIAHALAPNLPQHTLFAPATEPWLSIYNTTWKNGHNGNIQTGLVDGIKNLAADLQTAIIDAVDARARNLQNWWAQNSTGTGKKRRKTSEYRKVLSQCGYAFKFNLCTYEIECNGEPMTDETLSQIHCAVRDAGVWQSNVIDEVIRAWASENAYHPVKKYLTDLTFHGGDPISELGKFFTTDDGMFSQWLRRWLVGSVCRVFNHSQNRMLIMDGGQGIGKDYFVEWLCPLKSYFAASAILPDDKDYRLRRLKVWIWDVNEFGNTMRRQDREALKAFITDSDVIERKPYGKFDIRGHAISSYIGTVNNEMGILNDPTGNRRFITTHVTAIDWNYADQIDINQVWAQAFQLYLDGETGDLSDVEKQIVGETNESYQMIDIVEETIKKFFEVDPDNQAWWTSTYDIMKVLKEPILGNLKPGTEITTQKLSSSLTKLGLDKPRLHKVNSIPLRGYYGIRVR